MLDNIFGTGIYEIADSLAKRIRNLENRETFLQDWTTPTLGGTWVDFGGALAGAAYWRDPYGVVHLRGTIKSGSVPSTAFTLPADYRPTATTRFAVASNGAFGYVDVEADGDVVVQAGSATSVSLDSISFRTR